MSFSDMKELSRVINLAKHRLVTGALAGDTARLMVAALGGENAEGVHLLVAANKERGVQLSRRLPEITSAGKSVRVIAGWTYPTKEAFNIGLGTVPKGECILVVWAGKCNGLTAFLQSKEAVGARAPRSIVIDDAGTLRQGTCGPQLCYSRGGTVHNEVRPILMRHPDARVALVCPESGDDGARRELTGYLERLTEGKSRRKKKRIQKKRIQIFQGEDNLNTFASEVKITSVWTQTKRKAVAHVLEFVRKNQAKRGVVLVAANETSPDFIEVKEKLQQRVGATKWTLTRHVAPNHPNQTLVASGTASAVVALGDATPALRWVVFLGVTTPAQVAKAAHRLRRRGEILLVGCKAHADAALEAIKNNSQAVARKAKTKREDILQAGSLGVKAWKSICNPKECVHKLMAHNIGVTCDTPCTSQTPLCSWCERTCGGVTTSSHGEPPRTTTRGKRSQVASVDLTHSSDDESKVDLTHSSDDESSAGDGANPAATVSPLGRPDGPAESGPTLSSDDESKVDLTHSSDDESSAGDGANPAATVSPPGRPDGPAESGPTLSSDDESNAGDGATPAATVSPPGRPDGPAESGPTLSSDDESNAGDGATPAATVSPPGRPDGPAESGPTFASLARVWRRCFESNMEVPASTVVEAASRIQRRTGAGGSPCFSDSDEPDEPSPPPPRYPLPSDDDDEDDSFLNMPVRRAVRPAAALDETQNDEEDDSDVVDMTLVQVYHETDASPDPAAAVTPPPKKRPRTSSS